MHLSITNEVDRPATRGKENGGTSLYISIIGVSICICLSVYLSVYLSIL